MKATDPLLALAGHFALISLLAVGGANAVLPEMHRQAVDVAGWMTDRQFSELFALAQVAPGPNVMIVTLVGYQVAGLTGALVATVAMCGPTCLFAYGVARLWDRFEGAHWRKVVQEGLVWVTVGLIAASALVLTDGAATGWRMVVVTLVTAAVCCWTQINPLWALGGAALLGAAGLLG